jgi:hypothetical protein
LKGCFFRKQRHDDATEKPDRVALQSFLESVAQSLQRAFIGEHAVQRIKRVHASASRVFGAACGVS